MEGYVFAECNFITSPENPTFPKLKFYFDKHAITPVTRQNEIEALPLCKPSSDQQNIVKNLFGIKKNLNEFYEPAIAPFFPQRKVPPKTKSKKKRKKSKIKIPKYLRKMKFDETPSKVWKSNKKTKPKKQKKVMFPFAQPLPQKPKISVSDNLPHIPKAVEFAENLVSECSTSLPSTPSLEVSQTISTCSEQTQSTQHPPRLSIHKDCSIPPNHNPHQSTPEDSCPAVTKTISPCSEQTQSTQHPPRFSIHKDCSIPPNHNPHQSTPEDSCPAVTKTISPCSEHTQSAQHPPRFSIHKDCSIPPNHNPHQSKPEDSCPGVTRTISPCSVNAQNTQHSPRFSIHKDCSTPTNHNPHQSMPEDSCPGFTRTISPCSVNAQNTQHSPTFSIQKYCSTPPNLNPHQSTHEDSCLAGNSNNSSISFPRRASHLSKFKLPPANDRQLPSTCVHPSSPLKISPCSISQRSNQNTCPCLPSQVQPQPSIGCKCLPGSQQTSIDSKRRKRSSTQFKSNITQSFAGSRNLICECDLGPKQILPICKCGPSKSKMHPLLECMCTDWSQ